MSFCRCDGKSDCKDYSDEVECKVVEVSSSYNKFLTPPIPETAISEKLEILSTVVIQAFGTFDPIESNFAVKFTINLQWYDKRLRFNNLRSPPEIDTLQPNEVDRIWFPFFIFENTNKKEKSLLDSMSSLKVVKLGDGKLNDDTDTENKYVFNGKDNPIEYFRFYSQIFECEYSLHWYPFDTQTCYLDMKPSSDLLDFVQFVAENFKYEGPPDLTEYSVKKIDMKVVDENLLRVEIMIQRRLLSLVLTAFVPTIILNIIGHMSNYFKEFFFEGLMSLNVTVMLVLTTMFLR